MYQLYVSLKQKRVDFQPFVRKIYIYSPINQKSIQYTEPIFYWFDESVSIEEIIWSIDPEFIGPWSGWRNPCSVFSIELLDIDIGVSSFRAH